jgi:Na+/H+-dicarboxylate symporter
VFPPYIAAGIPVDGLILLEAVDAIPDIFKTILNVTSIMSVAAIVAPRRAGTGKP